MKLRTISVLGVLGITTVIATAIPKASSLPNTSTSSVKLNKLCNNITEERKNQEEKISELVDVLRKAQENYSVVEIENNKIISTAQGWIIRKQGIVTSAQQKADEANSWLAEKEVELEKEIGKQQPIIDAANEEIKTAQGWIDRKQNIVDAAQQQVNGASNWLTEKQAELEKEIGKQQPIINAANETIKTAQGWIDRKQAIVDSAQAQADAANQWLAEKEAELAKEIAKQQPIIDAANETIKTAQGWIDRKQAIVADAQTKLDEANAWLVAKQAELAKEIAKQQPIIDAANETIKTAQGWIDRKQAIVADAQQKVDEANKWLVEKQAELEKELAKQNPIIEAATLAITNAENQVTSAELEHEAAVLWLDGFNQGVEDYQNEVVNFPSDTEDESYIEGYHYGYELAAQCSTEV